jgi:hypothetical protein
MAMTLMGGVYWSIVIWAKKCEKQVRKNGGNW